ncbi:transposase [Streptomyces coelicolor]|nr:transposase [Streptomyces coelicolor]
MIWKFRSGARWREMPPEFGVWQTVYDRFVRWRDAGVFLALMDGVIAEAAPAGSDGLGSGQRGLHDRPGSSRRRGHASRGERLVVPGEGLRGVKGGRGRERKPQAEGEQDTSDRDREEWRRLRRRHRARPKAAPCRAGRVAAWPPRSTSLPAAVTLASFLLWARSVRRRIL